MRPIPAISTDVLYSAHFPLKDLIALGNALDVSDIKIITTTTLPPKRAMYHAVLNGIQTYLKLGSIEEATRAKEIADLADEIYAELLPRFEAEISKREPLLANKKEQATKFCQNLAKVEDFKPWKAQAFDSRWNTNDFPPRWQKKAIETYRLLRCNNKHADAGKVTLDWGMRNLEYKHYRDAARGMIEDHIEQKYADRLLPHQPIEKRIYYIFAGAMKSGKTELTKFFLRSRADADSFVLNNADYLKPALYSTALAEGIIPSGHKYKGVEVQAESSNALYEGVRKRTFLARQLFLAPNVIVNSIVLGEMELKEGIAGGGSIIAHHINISPEDSLQEADIDRGGRVVESNNMTWSNPASAKSLLILSRKDFAYANVTLHLYDRTTGKAPEYYGTVDAANKKIYILDPTKLAKLGQTAFPQMESVEAAKAFVDSFLNAGFEIKTRSHAHLLATQKGVINAAR